MSRDFFFYERKCESAQNPTTDHFGTDFARAATNGAYRAKKTATLHCASRRFQVFYKNTRLERVELPTL